LADASVESVAKQQQDVINYCGQKNGTKHWHQQLICWSYL